VDVRAEAELLKGLRQGSPAAFDALYEAYRERIYSFLYRLVGRRELADDLFQETWLKLARHGGALRDDTNVCAWLFTVARNQARSHHRRSALDRSYVREVLPAAAVDSPEAATAARHRLGCLERALPALTIEHREVLLLIGVEGVETVHAAAILGVSVEAVRQRLSRARAALAAALAKEELVASSQRGARS
jgi:RNA polymerase sigma-70 factor (ECF subfamily)